jgi:hypothetical protein
MRLTVRYRVSGTSLNLRWTSMSQSMRMARIFSLMYGCDSMYRGRTEVNSSFSRYVAYMSSTYAAAQRGSSTSRSSMSSKLPVIWYDAGSGFVLRESRADDSASRCSSSRAPPARADAAVGAVDDVRPIDRVLTPVDRLALTTTIFPPLLASAADAPAAPPPTPPVDRPAFVTSCKGWTGSSKGRCERMKKKEW